MIFYIMVHEHFKTKKPMQVGEIIYITETDDVKIVNGIKKQNSITKGYFERKFTERIRTEEKSVHCVPLLVTPSEDDFFSVIQQKFNEVLDIFKNENFENFKENFVELLQICNPTRKFTVGCIEIKEIFANYDFEKSLKSEKFNIQNFVVDYINLFYNHTIEIYHKNEIVKRVHEEEIILKKHIKQLTDTKITYQYEIFCFISLILTFLIYKTIHFFAPGISLPHPIKEGLKVFIYEKTAPKNAKEVEIKIIEQSTPEREIYVENTPLEISIITNQYIKKKRNYDQVINANTSIVNFLKQYDLQLITGRERTVILSLTDFIGYKVSDTKIASIVNAMKEKQKEENQIENEAEEFILN